MSDRDELESLVILGGGHAKLTASRILAAGYRKPRTITMAEELDALPARTMVMDRMDVPLTKFGGWWHSATDQLPPSAVSFPAVVLWEPLP